MSELGATPGGRGRASANRSSEAGDENQHSGHWTRRQRPSLAKQRRWFATPILAFVFVFYWWTGTARNPAHFGALGGEMGNRAKVFGFGTQTDYYNQLTDAFLKGHLSLLVHPPKGLSSLPNPYNPAQNGAPYKFQFTDLALYHGHFFLPWGPTPVITLLMPWRILHVGGMPLNLALIVYCFAGLLFAVALLSFLVDRYLPETKVWQFGLATAALALSNVAPFLLRRPAVYELAVASGYCFAMLGALLIATGGLGPHLRPWRLGFGSLSIGLAVGGRPTLIIEGLLLLALLAFLIRRDRLQTWADRLRLGTLLLGPFALLVVVLYAYNYARFGSIFQYGIQYTLSGADFSHVQSPKLAYVAPDVYFYVLGPVRWTFAFPYFSLAPPPAYSGALPSYYYTETTGGLLTMAPILFALVPAFALFRRRQDRELVGIIGLLVLTGTLMLLLLSVSFWFTTMRYEGDFATFFLLPALLAWFALTRLRYGRVVAVFGTAAILYGCTVGAAASIYGYYDLLRVTDPGTYWAIDRFTSPLPTLATMIMGHPVIARVFDPSSTSTANGGTYRLGSTPFQLSSQPLEMDVISPRTGRWTLAPTFSRGPDLGNLPVDVDISYSNGDVQRVQLGTSTRGFELALHRGLNRIDLRATSPGRESPQPMVSVEGVRLLR